MKEDNNNSFFQQEQIVLNNNLAQQVKKVIIVVGRMGHGKSSFCKMLTSEEERKKIIAKTSTSSVTRASTLFKVDKLNNIINGDIYILDTPGLDSKTSLSLVIEDIDDIVINQKIQLVGIAYILSIHEGRDNNSSGQGYILSFLQKLRLNYEFKINSIFFVLTKMDENLNTKKNGVIINQFKDNFKKIYLEHIWQRRIQWISEPCEEPDQQIQRALQDICNKITIQQFKRLKEILLDIKYINKQKYITFDQYKKDIIQYEQFFVQRIKQNLHNFNFVSKQNIQFVFDFIPQDLQIDKVLIMGGLTASSIGAGTSLVKNGFRYAAELAKQSKALSGLMITGTVGCAVSFLIAAAFGSYKVIWSQESKQQEKQQKLLQENANIEQMEDQQFFLCEYQKKINLKIKLIAIKLLTDIIKIKKNSLFIKKQTYYKNVKVYIKDHQNKEIILQKLDKGAQFQIKLLKGRIFISFTTNTPTIKQYQKFLTDFCYPKFKKL